MRTERIGGYAPYIFHVLSKTETWADYGMEQPNPWWAHIIDPPFECQACARA